MAASAINSGQGGEPRQTNEKRLDGKDDIYIEDVTNAGSEKGTPPIVTPNSEENGDFQFTFSKFLAILVSH